MTRSAPGLHPSAAALWVVAALVVITVVSPSAPAHAETEQPRDLATEVCEDMVRGAVVAAAGQELAQPQQGTWRGRRYVCRYDIGDGRLSVMVDVTRTSDSADVLFERRRGGARRRTGLSGIGDQAFQNRRTKAVVAQKDNFVLTVDPTDLPAEVDHDVVAWSTTRAIFDCW